MPWEALLVIELAVVINLVVLLVAAVGVARELLRDRRQRRR
jgi:heme exporter protein D